MDYLVKFNNGNNIEISQEEFNTIMFALNYSLNFATISHGVEDEAKKDYSFLLILKNVDCITNIKKEPEKTLDLSENIKWSKDFCKDVEIIDPLETIIKTQLDD